MGKFGSITLTDYTEGSAVYFSVDNYMFPANEDGEAVDALLEIDVVGYLGDQETPVTIGDITNIPTGMTVTVTNNGTISPTININITNDLTTTTGAITIPISINGIDYEKSFSYSLVTNWASTIAGLSSIVDTVNQNITDKIWRSDIITVEDLNGNEVQKSIQDILVQSTVDISGINNTVSSLKTTQDIITGDITSLETEISEISQKADQISLLVESDSNSSSLILTDEFVNVITDEFNIDGLTTFMNSAKDGSTTVIDGGAITADSIAVDKLNIDELSALKATIGGFTIGDSALYTNSKNSYNSIIDGVYVGNDGIGCGNFYVTEDGDISLGDSAFTYNATDGLDITGNINATSITVKDTYNIYTDNIEQEIINYTYNDFSSDTIKDFYSEVNFGFIDRVYTGDPYITIQRHLDGTTSNPLFDYGHITINASNILLSGGVGISGDLTFADDLGWRTDFTYTSGFAAYGTTVQNKPQFRKCGNIIEIRGAFKNTSDITISSETVMAKLPNGFTPTSQAYRIQQGSGTNEFLLGVTVNGEITISRYGGTTSTVLGSGSWLNIGSIFLLG